MTADSALLIFVLSYAGITRFRFYGFFSTGTHPASSTPIESE